MIRFVLPVDTIRYRKQKSGFSALLALDLGSPGKEAEQSRRLTTRVQSPQSVAQRLNFRTPTGYALDHGNREDKRSSMTIRQSQTQMGNRSSPVETFELRVSLEFFRNDAC